MRFSLLTVCLSLIVSSGWAKVEVGDKRVAGRQDSAGASSTFSTLSASVTPSLSNTNNVQSQTPTGTESSSTNIRSSDSATPRATSTVGQSTSAATASLSANTSGGPTNATSAAPSASSTAISNSTSEAKEPQIPLPLLPRITPAFCIGGVFLILVGIVYALIGVKNRWVHVFISTAFLTSLAVLVLIVYVANPPVSNSVQGAYFVGAFMSGLIFGGGALLFKEVTEGLGCLLGGFCLSMWFLTLKEGGLITNTSGKAIFIAIFCVVCWSLSFSHYTRAYGLIGSTSFAGSTAFVLGIDCFSRGGLKEFWLYIWALNDDLFPLNTNTYPITKGTRVETVIIILGTIIGMISQIKLWKVVQNRQKRRATVQAEVERRRDAVEEALGRHLERQNDRDRSEWERQYGNRLDAKRSTILWSEGQSEDKGFSSTSTTEIDSSQNSEFNDSVKMIQMHPAAPKPVKHSSQRKRQSNISVHPIQEVEEEEQRTYEERNTKNESVIANRKHMSLVLPEIESDMSEFHCNLATSPSLDQNNLTKTCPKDSTPQIDESTSLKPSKSKPSSRRTSDRLHLTEADARPKETSSVPSLNDLKRRSLQSLRSVSFKDGEKTPRNNEFSQSQEALVQPQASNGTPSRASSVAATMDEENEMLEMPTLDFSDNLERGSRPPQILISPAGNMRFDNQLSSDLIQPPSPSGLSDGFDADPEALIRPAANEAHGFDFDIGSKWSSGNTDILFKEAAKSTGQASQSSSSEGLTKVALDRVPSQMSDVVLSYRTNEWAKHIATAEAPTFEEPDSIVVQDDEAPTRLVDPVPPPTAHSAAPVTGTKPPLLQSLVTSVAPSAEGVKINPDIQPVELMRSRPASEIDSGSVTGLLSPPLERNATFPSMPPRTHSVTSTSNGNRRSFTDSIQRPLSAQSSQAPQTRRRISNPGQMQSSTLQSTPIDENVATDFDPRHSALKRESSTAHASNSQQYNNTGMSQDSPLRLAASASIRHHYPSAFKRTSSPTAYQNQSQPDLRPLSPSHNVPSGGAIQHPMQHPIAMRSATRLANNGSKSHQPLQRNNTDESRRETLMADWRLQLANSVQTNVIPVAEVDGRYVQQMYDYESDKMRREQQKRNAVRQELAMDQSMRTQGMMDAHREVLKRMQSQANSKLIAKKE